MKRSFDYNLLVLLDFLVDSCLLVQHLDLHRDRDQYRHHCLDLHRDRLRDHCYLREIDPVFAITQFPHPT